LVQSYAADKLLSLHLFETLIILETLLLVCDGDVRHPLLLFAAVGDVHCPLVEPLSRVLVVKDGYAILVHALGSAPLAV
jgi:hypothetical protein